MTRPPGEGRRRSTLSEREGPIARDLVDFHNHVLPGVDDGARDVEEAVTAVAALEEEGVGVVVATPHFPASLTERPAAMLERLERIDEAFETLRGRVERSGREVRLERGVEVRLNVPEPDLSDARLRLAGTHFVLVEFSAFQMPAYGARQLAELRRQGWYPVLAHPERYAGMTRAPGIVESWRRHAFFQLNAGSLTGEYGPEARKAARVLFERGWVDYLSSDYHARGRPGLSAARDVLDEAERIHSPGESVAEERDDPEEADVSGLEVARLLTEVNPRRLLESREPLPVPAVRLGGRVWDRVRDFFA